jgi:SAM-dependent methyltransferase
MVVDVVCGTGRAAGELQALGHDVLGLDSSQDMITTAINRWPQARFQLGDACRLPLSDSEVTGYRADKLFHELAHPERALDEACRVLRPGGRIVVVGQDLDTIAVDPAIARARHSDTRVHSIRRPRLMPQPSLVVQAGPMVGDLSCERVVPAARQRRRRLLALAVGVSPGSRRADDHSLRKTSNSVRPPLSGSKWLPSKLRPSRASRSIVQARGVGT